MPLYLYNQQDDRMMGRPDLVAERFEKRDLSQLEMLMNEWKAQLEEYNEALKQGPKEGEAVEIANEVLKNGAQELKALRDYYQSRRDAFRQLHKLDSQENNLFAPPKALLLAGGGLALATVLGTLGLRLLKGRGNNHQEAEEMAPPQSSTTEELIDIITPDGQEEEEEQQKPSYRKTPLPYKKRPPLPYKKRPTIRRTIAKNKPKKKSSSRVRRRAA